MFARSIRFAAGLSAGLALGGCGSGSDPSSATGPLIVAVVAGFEPDAAHGGFPGSALVRVMDPSTQSAISSATVSVNGSTLPFGPDVLAYQGTVQIAPGATVRVRVATGDGTWEASATQVPSYPTVVSPTAGETWSGMRTNELRWTVPSAPQGSVILTAVFDAAGVVAWPSDGVQQMAPQATSVALPPAALAPGNYLAVVALASRTTFPNAAAGSTLVVEGAGVAGFEARNGVQIVAAAGPAHLQVAGGKVAWSEGNPSAVKAAPSGGGPAQDLVRSIPMPESVQVAGDHLYFVSGNQLLRSAVDGTGVAVLATGLRTGPMAGTTDLVVDASDVYWVNTTTTGTWAIVRTPLAGGPSTTFATTPARVIGLAADETTIYWEQQGSGPVSSDGTAPADSAVLAAAKQGGDVRLLVNGYLNGPVPVLPPGQLPGNWFGTGGIVIAGGDLLFAETGFSGSYRLLRVGTAGGPLTVVHSATSSDSGSYARRISTDGTTLFWVDGTSVNAVPVAGGDAVQLAGGLFEATSLAVSGGRVVWSDNDCCRARQAGLIRMVPAAGGAVVTLASARDFPTSISADGLGAFWTEGGAYGAIEGYGGIARVSLSGGTAEMLLSTIVNAHPPLATDGTTLFLADGWRVKSAPLAGGSLGNALVGFWVMVDTATDGRSVFGLDGQGNVLATPIGGGSPTVLAAGLFGPASHLRHAAGYLYWVDRGDTLRRVPVTGGPVETLSTNLQPLSDLVSDGTTVYLADLAFGRILKVPTSGGVPTTLASGKASGPVSMVLAGRTLYWIDSSHIGKVDLDNGASILLARGIATDPAVPSSIGVDDAALYWTETATGAIQRSVDR